MADGTGAMGAAATIADLGHGIQSKVFEMLVSFLCFKRTTGCESCKKS